jgi:putative membrane protein
MNEKAAARWIWFLSAFVLVAVVLLNRKVIHGPAEPPHFTRYLPLLNACINGTCAVLLLLSLFFISRKKIPVHRALNLTALALSSVFLISYITLHFFADETLFGDVNHNGLVEQAEKDSVGAVRFVYYLILGTHILLAGAGLPFILFSFYRGLNMQVEKHRRIVRWSFPIWLYVTVTGVVVYLMIAPYYNFPA